MQKFGHRGLLVMWLSGVMLTVVEGAIAPRTVAELSESAEVIVTGKVTAAEVSTEGSPLSSDWVVVLQAEVGGVEKGEVIRKGEMISVRCWRVKRRPAGWAGPGGHDEIPAVGSRCRMWLSQGEGGGWRVLEPNGVELLEGATHFDFSKEGGSAGLGIAKFAAGVAVVVVVFLLVLRRVTATRRRGFGGD